MNVTALKRNEIIQALTLLREEQLEKVRIYIDSVLLSPHVHPKSNRSLKGIWQGKGFEKLYDLEGEVKAARQQMRETILKKDF